MAYKLLNDKKTFANINSENPTVCFLHGWGRSSQDFYLISQSFDYINFDLPGFGKSQEPEISMNPKEYAEYINQFIPNSVETVVGHSFGGRVAVHLSRLRNFEKLILIGVPLIKKQTSSGKLSILNFYKSLNRFGILSNDKIEKIKKKKGSYDYRNSQGIMRENLVKAVNDDLSKELENIKSKVHLIWGSEDKEVPIDIAKEANKKIKKSNLHILEGQGHNPLNSSYVEIVNIINT
tara:strand:- start:13043 stop:13750 length:708 start_codon:yes stop_codon:yes gene_type:complete